MKHITAAAICLSILTLAFPLYGAHRSGGTTPSQVIPKWFWGCWVVKKELPVPTAIVGVSTERAKSIIGTRMVFAPSCVRSGGTVVRPASYSVTVLTSWEFLREHHGSGSEITLHQIGVRSGHVAKVQVAPPEGMSDLDFVASDCYLRERRKDIVIEVEGDTFIAKKAKAADPQCACVAPGAGQSRRKKQ